VVAPLPADVNGLRCGARGDQQRRPYSGRGFCALPRYEGIVHQRIVTLSIIALVSATAGSALGQTADIVAVNGKVFTARDGAELAQGFAVKGEKFIAVGSTEAMRAHVGANTKVIDLAGRFVAPGLADGHFHNEGGGPGIDLSATRSIADLLAVVGAAAAEAKPGDVIVIDNGGRPDTSCWGGLLALAAKTKGISGVIIDGACRDVDESRDVGFPVFARGAVPMTARGRVMQESYNQEIEFAGVQVHSGDLVIADGSGVVIIPRSKEEEVVREAEAVAATEARMAEGIRQGMSVLEVLEKLGYEQMLKK